MVSLDDTSLLIEVPVAETCELTAIKYCTLPQNKDVVLVLQSFAQLLKDMVINHQSYINTRRVYDLKSNHSPERIERAWAALIKNKANLNEFKKGHPNTTYLEARKIFLPQGATLILEYWQRELNEFVSELESVSISDLTRRSDRDHRNVTDKSQISADPTRVVTQKVRSLYVARAANQSINNVNRHLLSSSTTCLGPRGRALLACSI